MSRKKRSHNARPFYLPVLILVSVGALLLPPEWTGKLISLVQVVVPLQHVATAAAETLGTTIELTGAPVSAEEFGAVARERTALAHQVVALATRVGELERDVELLQGTRLWDASDSLGARGTLIPARIISDDLLSWRSSRLINAGALLGVHRGAPVASRYFHLDRGDEAGVSSGMAILLRETLVGTVDQVGTHTSRFILLSDVSVERKVRLGRLTQTSFDATDGYFWLRGRGAGVMEIRDVDRRDVRVEEANASAGAEPKVQVGDVVLSDPASELLPSSLVIGRVVRIEPDRKNPLLVVLTVHSDVDEGALRRVYVYDPAVAGS